MKKKTYPALSKALSNKGAARLGGALGSIRKVHQNREDFRKHKSYDSKTSQYT